MADPAWFVQVSCASGAPCRWDGALPPRPGPEWMGHRDYAPGDDIRAVDWGRCARHDELNTRQVGGVIDGRVYFLLDCSRSMGLGTPTKFSVAQRLLRSLAALALRGQNQVRISTFAGGLLADSEPFRGQAALGRLEHFLGTLRPEFAPTDFARCAAAWARRYQRHGIVTVLSDLCNRRGFELGLGALRQRGYHPNVLQLYAPEEAEPDFVGDAFLADAESAGGWLATVTEEHLEHYRRLFVEFLAAVRQACNRQAFPWAQIRTDRLPAWASA